MVLFVDYPQEIVDSILQWLSPKDIYALCLVDKSCYAATQPWLYSRIEWEWGNQVPPVDILLRTLLEKPALGECVQSVILKGTDRLSQFHFPTKPVRPRFDDGGVGDLVAFVKSRELSRRHTNDWVNGLRSPRSTLKMNAYITCLLAMLPNIRYLRLEPRFAAASKLSSRMFRAALSVFPRQNKPKLPRFEQLRDVAYLRRIGSIPSNRPKAAHFLTPFFYLPKVHRISASVDNTPYWRWPEHRPALETLTTLNIAYIHAKHLGTILSETKNLQTLRWDWRGWPFDRSTNDHWVNLDEIMVAFQHVQKTLIKLEVLGSCHYLSRYRSSVRLTGRLHDMVSFKKLKTLEIPLAFLVGISASDPPKQIGETLPTTVEDVTLTDDFCRGGDWQGGQQLELFSLWMDNLKAAEEPRLRRFVWATLLRDTIVVWYNESVLEGRLLALCGSAEIEVEVIQRYERLERKPHLGWE